jgi:EF hand domain-containing protein
MRTALLMSAVLLVGTGYALAGPGAGESKEPADPAAGRPSAVLDDAKCANVWSLTQRQGDTLSEGQAAPFIVNFKLVDVDGNGQISEAEFKDGCKKGLVQEASATGTQKPSGTSTPMGAQPKTNPPAQQ